MRFSIDDIENDDNDSNVIMIPMVIPKGVFSFLTNIAAKEGKTGSQLFVEKFRHVITELEKENGI